MPSQVVNHVASTDGSAFKPGAEHGAFDATSDYHPYCVPDYSVQTTVEQCWLGDDNVILPDVRLLVRTRPTPCQEALTLTTRCPPRTALQIDTEDDTVIEYYNNWIKQLILDYSCVPPTRPSRAALGRGD